MGDERARLFRFLFLQNRQSLAQAGFGANQTLYQTSFEPPAFTPGPPIRGQDNWEMYHDGEAISVSTNNSRTGVQCLRFDGVLLEQDGPNHATAYCFSRALDALTNNPLPIIEITASVRLDGPQTGTNRTPEQDILSANLMAVTPRPDGRGDLLGGFFVSSAGKIFSYSPVPGDNYRYSVPYAFGTYRTLTLRVDFIAREMTWIVDGVALGSGSFLSTITADRLISGYLYLSGPLEPINTPELTYDMTNYTAYFDDYSLNSVLAESPTILVEQPTGTRLANGASIVDFGNSLVGTPSPRVFTLRNAGNAPLEGVTVTVEGAHAGEFRITTPPSGTVAPGGSTLFTITFTPAAEGARSAALRIASNDPDDNPFTLALTGHGRSPAEIVQQAYIKASNTGVSDWFGFSVAVSGDTLVVGAPLESSNARGVNGNQANDAAGQSGAAYVFVREGTNWIQQAYLKASNSDAGDGFGSAVAISRDTIVVGAPRESSSATGVNGNQANNSAFYSGAAYVFLRDGTNWTQQAYLKASNTGAEDGFGESVAISGNTIVVGAMGEASNATGVNGDQSNNSAVPAGAAYVFVREGTNWTQQAYLKASNTGQGDFFGRSVAISGDTVVVGADGEASNATGVNGNQANNSAPYAGAAYVFVREGTNWTQQAYLKASNTASDDYFAVVAISGDTIVVGAPGEDSNATGVNGNQANNSAETSGAAYVFVRAGTNWTQQAYLKASNTGQGDWFGVSVAIWDDAIVVGAPYEDSNARGVNGNQANNSTQESGAAYGFVREGTNWTQQAYLKASNTESSNDLFGGDSAKGVAISGNTIVVGAAYEDSNATGVNGSQNNNSAGESGAAYVFTGAASLLPEPPPRILSIARDINGTTRLIANAITGRSYTLQSSETLTNWTDLATQSATTNRIEFTDTPTNSPAMCFYRVKQD